MAVSAATVRCLGPGASTSAGRPRFRSRWLAVTALSVCICPTRQRACLSVRRLGLLAGSGEPVFSCTVYVMLPFTRARDGGTSEAYTPSRAGDKDCCAAHVHSHGGSNSVKRKSWVKYTTKVVALCPCEDLCLLPFICDVPQTPAAQRHYATKVGREVFTPRKRAVTRHWSVCRAGTRTQRILSLERMVFHVGKPYRRRLDAYYQPISAHHDFRETAESSNIDPFQRKCY